MRKKSIILSSVVLGITAFAFVMFFMPILSGASMFQLMQIGLMLLPEGAESTITGLIMGLFQLLAFIEIMIMIGFEIVALLNACGVVKSEKLAKTFRIVNIVFSSLITAAMLVLFLLLIIGEAFYFGIMLYVIISIALIILTAVDKKIAGKVVSESSETITIEQE